MQPDIHRYIYRSFPTSAFKRATPPRPVIPGFGFNGGCSIENALLDSRAGPFASIYLSLALISLARTSNFDILTGHTREERERIFPIILPRRGMCVRSIV